MSKFNIYTRKNLQEKAQYKRASKLEFVITVVGGNYAVEWIEKNGNKENIYVIFNENEKQIGKYCYDKNKGWHKSFFEQELNPNNTVRNRKLGDWLDGNLNKKK